MINSIASDLGIYRYEEESFLEFECRVVYSAIACWMKAIALDKPVGYQDSNMYGVSRRHIYERCHTVLGTMVKMFPGIEDWFDLSSSNDDPINLIRKRLINHGDLLNAGFDTNLALSSFHSDQLTSVIETTYGNIIDNHVRYEGVATVRCKDTNTNIKVIESVDKWLSNFLSDVSWSSDLPDLNQLEFFNPLSTTKNHYSAWQESIVKPTDNIILARSTVNKNSYFYYLLKAKEKLVHKLDPFLQEQGYNNRIMYALRLKNNNKTKAVVTRYNDHIKIRFNAVLPLEENIILESYAWPLRRIDDKLEWVMSKYIWEYFWPHIEALGINVLEENNGQIRR